MNKAVRILVVDDEMIVREALSNYLREDGYEAVAVETGEEALKKVEGERWNVLFVDLKMPYQQDSLSLYCQADTLDKQNDRTNRHFHHVRWPGPCRKSG